MLEIEWAVKHGKEFVPSPRKPRKPRGKKRKVATINLNRGREEGPSMCSAGQASLDEGDETVYGYGAEESLLGKLKEEPEEYEENTVMLGTPAKRVKSEVE